MSIVRQDTFTRANQSGWGTASDGNAWTKQFGDGTQAIASNEGTVSGSSASSTFETLGAALASADAEGLVRWSVSNNSDLAGMILRWQNSNNHWLARYDGSGHLVAMVKVSGSYTTLSPSIAFTPTANTFYWLRFRVQGTTISIKHWADGSAEPGSWDQQWTNSNVSSAGMVGLYGFAGGTNKYDSFSVDDLAGAIIQGTIDFGHQHALGLAPGGLIAGALGLQHNQALALGPSPRMAGQLDLGHGQGLALSPGGLIAGALSLSHEQSLGLSPGALKQGTMDLGQQQQLSLAPVMQASDNLALQHQSGLALTPGALIQGALDFVHSHGLAETWLAPVGSLTSPAGTVADAVKPTGAVADSLKPAGTVSLGGLTGTVVNT